MKKWLDDNLKKGYSKEEIIKYLKNQGYSEEYIREIMGKKINLPTKKEFAYMATIVVVLVGAFYFLGFFGKNYDIQAHADGRLFSKETGLYYDSEIKIVECIKERVEVDQKIISWWDLGKNIVRKSNRVPIADSPSEEFLYKYSASNNTPFEKLTNPAVIHDISLMHATGNYSEAGTVFKKYGAEYLLMDAELNKEFVPLFQEIENTECQSYDCSFASWVAKGDSTEKNECYQMICYEFPFVLIRKVC